jgi:hypothetical protein
LRQATALRMSLKPIFASSRKTCSTVTSARDPENDGDGARVLQQRTRLLGNVRVQARIAEIMR